MNDNQVLLQIHRFLNGIKHEMGIQISTINRASLLGIEYPPPPTLNDFLSNSNAFFQITLVTGEKIVLGIKFIQKKAPMVESLYSRFIALNICSKFLKRTKNFNVIYQKIKEQLRVRISGYSAEYKAVSLIKKFMNENPEGMITGVRHGDPSEDKRGEDIIITCNFNGDISVFSFDLTLSQKKINLKKEIGSLRPTIKTTHSELNGSPFSFIEKVIKLVVYLRRRELGVYIEIRNLHID